MTEGSESRLDNWTARLTRLPRLVRMVLNGLIALLLGAMLALLLSLLVGEAALTDADTALFIFSVAMIGGLIAYVVGYWSSARLRAGSASAPDPPGHVLRAGRGLHRPDPVDLAADQPDHHSFAA